MRHPLTAFVFCIAMALAACGGSAHHTPTPAATPQPTAAADIILPPNASVTIGVSVALSGDQQAIGQDIADAAELAIADHGGSIKGHPILAVRKDDGCTDALKAVSVARSFIADASVAGVIGPMCTTGAQAADRLYEAAHIIHVSPSATRVELSQQGERYFFRMAWSDNLQADIQATYAYGTAKAASAVVVDDGEPYGKGLSDAFAGKFQSLGGTVLSHERVDRGAVDFSALVKGVLSMKPDIVVFEGLNPEAALFVKELRNQQYSGTFMAPDGVFSAHDYLDAAGAASDGSIISGGPQPDAAFIAKFQAKYQRAPQTAFVLQAYDAATVLIGAIDATATAGSDGSLHINRARLADELRSKKTLGLTGVISFDAHGDRVGPTPAEVGLVLYKVSGGRFEPLP